MKRIEELIKECGGKCYFKYCVCASGKGLRLNRSGCPIISLCKPFIMLCSDGENKFVAPSTHTPDTLKVKYAEEKLENKI